MTMTTTTMFTASTATILSMRLKAGTTITMTTM